jgi:hypothetical protein
MTQPASPSPIKSISNLRMSELVVRESFSITGFFKEISALYETTLITGLLGWQGLKGRDDTIA